MNHLFSQFIQSAFFENKCIGLRKRFGFLSQAYNRAFDINLLQQGTRTESQAMAIEESQAALRQLKLPTSDSDVFPSSQMPKVIWLYWNTPIETAPEVVQLSIRSWRELNPGYDVNVLTDSNLSEVLGFDFNAAFRLSTIRLSMAAKADILRLYLLSRFGGVWADSTTFCLEPLDNWLPDAMACHAFFSFRHNTNPTRPIEAWFLAAPKQSPVTRHTLKLFLDYVFKPRERSLFTSNKRKMMEKIGVTRKCRNTLYADTVYKAEQVGFMPYFTVGYFFNEALRKFYSPGMVQAFYDLPNAHAIHETEHEKFLKSVVSKQTYKGTYQNEALFLARRGHLMSLLDKAKTSG